MSDWYTENMKDPEFRELLLKDEVESLKQLILTFARALLKDGTLDIAIQREATEWIACHKYMRNQRRE